MRSSLTDKLPRSCRDSAGEARKKKEHTRTRTRCTQGPLHWQWDDKRLLRRQNKRLKSKLVSFLATAQIFSLHDQTSKLRQSQNRDADGQIARGERVKCGGEEEEQKSNEQQRPPPHSYPYTSRNCRTFSFLALLLIPSNSLVSISLVSYQIVNCLLVELEMQKRKVRSTKGLQGRFPY